MTAPRPAAELARLSVDTIRCLSMDAVQKANSGHPGTPMALAPAAYTLFRRHLRHSPSNPGWWNRDRFVLSCGHASMLLYSLLHLTGYDLSLDDLKAFRQWGSRTPGHPEFRHTAGVETTTGPLGQGFANGVGMAIAEKILAERYNRPGYEIFDHRTFAFCSDGDLMEGVAQEAISMAGFLKLGKLVYLWDDNRITIEGSTELSFDHDEVPPRFEAAGWHVVRCDAPNDIDALSAAFTAGERETEKPTLIVLRSHIGYPSPNKTDSHEAHGAPLGEDEIRATKKVMGWPEDETFRVPAEVAAHMREVVDRGRHLERHWDESFARWSKEHHDLAKELKAAMAGKLPDGWEAGLPSWTAKDGGIETRKASGVVLNALAAKLPTLVGGSADLAPSNNTALKGGKSFGPGQTGRNFHFGIREHAMTAVANGMALHGGVRPFTASFLIFTDYCRPSLRLAALMGLPTLHVFTHDSIGLGEDGPTHQPVETLAALRAIPNFTVIRPADANETAAAWKVAIAHADGPVLLALTRQKLPVLDPETFPAVAAGVAKGGYVLADAAKPVPDAILIATGSEVPLALEAKQMLAADGIDARVVSLPSWELFDAQSPAYRESVLPKGVRARVSIEAGITMGWHRFVGDDGIAIGIDHFGASAPAPVLFEKFGLTATAVADAARSIVRRA